MNETDQPTIMIKASSSQAQKYLRYSDEDLKEFEGIIKAKLEGVEKIVFLLKGSCLNQNGTDNNNPVKFDNARETLSKEENNDTIIRQEKFVRDLNNALKRIGNKSYGICRATGKLINKERLKLVPHATLSMEAKNERDSFHAIIR